jgi:hypothetical protein
MAGMRQQPILIVREIVTDHPPGFLAFFIAPTAFGRGDWGHNLGRPRLDRARAVEIGQIGTRLALRQMHVRFFGGLAHARRDYRLTRKDQTKANDETDCAPNRRNVSDIRRISRTARNRYQIDDTKKGTK